MNMNHKYTTLSLLIAGVLAIFVGRALLASRFDLPRSFEIFDSLTVMGSLVVVGMGYRHLRHRDWVLALALGLVIGIEMHFATLFSPYPFLGVVSTNLGQAILRGAFTTSATLGSLVVMRLGGPVTFHSANQDWKRAGRSALMGLGIGLPLAALNVFALQATQGNGIQWQNPLAALADALQPGIVEEILYRFALWGQLWLLLRASLPEKAAWISGLLAMLVHNFAHFDDLFLQSPLTALGMWAVLALVWGLPSLILAHRKGLEAAIAFHWIQDVVRFVAGF
jgi:hypothetical protein